VFIDFLAERVPGLVESARLQCGDIPGGKPCPEGVKNGTSAPAAMDKPIRKPRERTAEPA
jgi:hypothetical protein